MFLPRSRTARTRLWNRRPSQTSQRTVTSARNCMSIVCQPVPRHASQRPPAELNEKSRAVMPREMARADFAKVWRISSQAFV